MSLKRPSETPITSSTTSTESNTNKKAKTAKPRSKSKDILALRLLKVSSKYWTIKVRVGKKLTPKTYSNAKGTGVLSSVELIDADSTQIKVTMFNEVSRKYWPMFEEGKVFLITGGSIRKCDPKYNQLGHPCEITLGSYSRVQKVDDDPAIPSSVFDLVPIEMLTQKDPNDPVDVQGVIIDIEECKEIVTKRQTTAQRRNLIIVDDTAHDIEVTLWGDSATKEYTCGQILRITRCRLDTYGGLRITSSFGSDLSIVYDKDLIEWYKTAPRPFEHLSHATKIHYMDPRTTLQAIKDLKMEEGDMQLLQVRGSVAKITANSESPPWYKACPECNGKLADDEVEGYFCDKCTAPYSEYVSRYILRVQIADQKDKITVTLFDHHAQQLVGKSAQEMDALLQEGCTEEFDSLFSQATGSIRLFKIKVQLEQSKESLRFQYTVVDLVTIDPVKEEEWIKQYGTKTFAEMEEAATVLGFNPPPLESGSA